MGEQESFVAFGIGFCVGDVIDMASVGTYGPRVDGSGGEVKDSGLEFDGVGLVTEEKRKANIRTTLVINIVVDLLTQLAFVP